MRSTELNNWFSMIKLQRHTEVTTFIIFNFLIFIFHFSYILELSTDLIIYSDKNIS